MRVLPVIRAIAAIGVAFAAAACPSSGDRWSIVHEELPGALLSVWGSAADDVWAVGGDAGDGPMVLHFDGDRWRRLATGERGDLWWVHGFSGGPVLMGGRGGMILRYEDGAFERMTTPGTATVFGIWGSAPDDLWAVGGNDGGGSGAFAWRFDGETWAVAEGVPAELSAGGALWKVWGRGADDVWLVGTEGTALHHDGESLRPVATGSTRPLFTVHGDGERVAAVGGFGDGLILEYDGTTWSQVAPPQTPHLMGVHLGEEVGYAVGVDGTVLRRAGGAWAREPIDLGIFEALHAVWVDPDGGVWAVGGQVLSFPLIRGILLHRGPAIPGGRYEE